MCNSSVATTAAARCSSCLAHQDRALSTDVLPEVTPSSAVQLINPYDERLSNLFDTNMVDDAAALILSISASLRSSVLSACRNIPSWESCAWSQVRVHKAAKSLNLQSIISSTKTQPCTSIGMKTHSDWSTGATIITRVLPSCDPPNLA